MSRILCTAPFPRVPASIPENVLVITPHRPAAETLRRPGFTLQNLARRTLAANGLYVAESRVCARMLRESILEVLPESDPSAIARRIASVLKTILRVGIDTTYLKQIGEGRAAELAAIAETFRLRLRDEGLVHADETVWQAANAPRVETQTIYVYGYTRGRSEEIAFIDRIAADGSKFHLPAVGGSDAFAANSNFALQLSGRGWTIDESGLEPEKTGEIAAAKFFGLDGNEAAPDISAHVLHDVSSEVRFVLGEVKKLLRGGTSAHEIAVVARDLNLYAKECALVGDEYSVPTMSSLKIPLAETLVGGLLRRLLSTVEEEFTFEETVKLLGHPLGPGMSDATWRHSRRFRTEGYEQWLELEESLGCLAKLRVEGPKRSAEWVKCLREVFARFGVRDQAGHSAREIVAYNCLQDELSFLESEPVELTFSDLATVLQDILASVRTKFDPSRLGVLITEPNFVAGGRFRHLFVLGMAEGVLPALPVDNPVIDFHERRFLAKRGIDFEGAADIPRWESLAFFGLLSSAADSVVLTYPKTIGNEEKLESSFFRRLGLEPADATPGILASSEEFVRNVLRKEFDTGDPILSASARRLAVERTRESAVPCDEYDGVFGEAIDVSARTWSVSQLSTLAGCGFRWFVGYGLGIRPMDEMELEISPASRGKLFHYALDFAVSKGNAKTREEIIRLLDHALAAGYHDPDVGMPRVPNWDLRRADYLKQLRRAVEAGEFLLPGAEIVATEQEFSVTVCGLRVRGRIDRVDRTPDGITPVDYKTASKKPDAVRDHSGRKVDLQIGVYLAALKELYPQQEVSGGRYYSLTACKSFPADAVDDAVLEAFLKDAADAPAAGSLPVRPVSANTCTYCDFDRLCRKGSRIVRKEAAR